MSQSDTNLETGSDGSNPRGDVPETTLQELAERVDGLSSELEAERERRRELEQKLEDANSDINFLRTTLFDLEEIVFGDVGSTAAASIVEEDGHIFQRLERVEDGSVDQTSGQSEDEIEDLRHDLADARNKYSQQAAMLQKRFTALEDELDINTMDLVTDDDHISRLIANGPEDIYERVYAKHSRAREMLLHANDWGEQISDELGDRVVFKSGTVKPFFKTAFGKPFQSTEIKRVFEVVESLGEKSSRRVSLDKDQEGEHRLSVWGVE